MGQLYSRKHPRWPLHDYASPGAYFVTTITHKRRWILGVPTRRGIALTDAGRIVHRCWATVAEQFDGVLIDALVVMPNHVHAIVVLKDARERTTGLSAVVAAAKQHATREIAALNRGPRPPIWQRSFHDRIIRDVMAWERVRNYIAKNPSRAWSVIQIRRRDAARSTLTTLTTLTTLL